MEEEKDWLVTLAYPNNPQERFQASTLGKDWEDAYNHALKENPYFNVIRVEPYWIEEEEYIW